MSYSYNDDPTIPPPGRRSGRGAESIVPYLVKTLASKPQAHAQERDDTHPRRPLPVLRKDTDTGSDGPDVLL